MIGAGLAGLAAARSLADAGVTVTVFEKSRGVGGRTATRREGLWAFDHGAQYATFRDARLAPWVQSWAEAEVLVSGRRRLRCVRAAWHHSRLGDALSCRLAFA